MSKMGEMALVYEEGKLAAREGVKKYDCPYQTVNEAYFWSKGYDEEILRLISHRQDMNRAWDEGLMAEPCKCAFCQGHTEVDFEKNIADYNKIVGPV